MTTGTDAADAGSPRRDPARRRLVVHRGPTALRAAVLFLHGGRADSTDPLPLLNLPALRMRPFLGAVARAAEGNDVLLASVRYRCRGWNGEAADAARDARQALDDLVAHCPGVPIVLIGHSMGGRAALHAGGHPAVRGVIALAPWCPPGEPVSHLRGKLLALLHDARDRITDYQGSRDFSERARQAGADAQFLTMSRGRHAMLRDAGRWHRTTARLTHAMLAAHRP